MSDMTVQGVGPALASVAGLGWPIEVGADGGESGRELTLHLWLSPGSPYARLKDGFWIRVAGGVDMFFEPAAVLFNRAAFKSARCMLVSDDAPRVPDVWLHRASA